MKFFSPDQIDQQSFTDAKLLAMKVNLQEKLVELLLHGGWIISNGVIVPTLDVKIIVSSWDKLNIFIEERDAEEFKNKNPLTSEILGSICQFEYNKNLILRGYGENYNGCWTEWVFINPKLSICGSFGEENDKENEPCSEN